MQTGYGKMMKKAEKAEKKQAKGKKLSRAEMRKLAAKNAIEKHSK